MRNIAYNIFVRRKEQVKRRELIKLLERSGWKLHRHGANHDVYMKGNEREPIPRHPEIKDSLARAIIKRRGLK